MSTHALLAESPLFLDMTPEECSVIVQLSRFDEYPTGKTLLREGTRRPALNLLLSGECVVVKTLRHGAEHQLALLRPGALFGEIAFFDRGEHSSTVRSLSPVEVMELSWPMFEELRSERQEIACKLTYNTARIMAERFRKMHRYTVDLIDHPAVETSEASQLTSLHSAMFH